MSTLAAIWDAHVKDMRWAVCGSSSRSQTQEVTSDITQLFQQLPPNRNLRSSHGIQHNMQRTRTKFAERDFVHRGKTYWREIPYEIQNATSVNAFKQQLIRREIFKHERWESWVTVSMCLYVQWEYVLRACCAESYRLSNVHVLMCSMICMWCSMYIVCSLNM